MKLPWMKFFPSDWLSDEGLRSCSIAARGLWIDLIAMMAKSNTHGYLLIGGSPASVEQISRIAGEDADTTRKLLQELERNGVFSRDEDNVVFSRRMKRDEAERKSNADRQMRYQAKNRETKAEVKEYPKKDKADLPKRDTPKQRPTKEEWLAYAKTIVGWSIPDAENAYDYYESNGWKVGGKTPVKDWMACARTCSRRATKSVSQPTQSFSRTPIQKPAIQSSCESPPVEQINYDSVPVVMGLISTALKEGLSLALLKASTPKNVWDKAYEQASKETLCPA